MRKNGRRTINVFGSSIVSGPRSLLSGCMNEAMKTYFCEKYG